MKRALTCATAYFVMLFSLGLVLGTIRVLVIAPMFGTLGAVVAEIPVMLIAAVFACRWAVRRWRAPSSLAIRFAMVGWFLALLALFETVLGTALFGRTISEQWAMLTTPTGLVGVSAQLIAGLLPLFVGRRVSS